MATQTTPKTKSPTPPTKKRRAKGEHDARLNFRINSEQKEKIEQAALQRGQTLSEFAAQTLLERAEAVIDAGRTTFVREEEWARIVAALEDPPEISPELRDLGALWHAHTRHEGDTTCVSAEFFQQLPEQWKGDPH